MKIVAMIIMIASVCFAQKYTANRDSLRNVSKTDSIFIVINSPEQQAIESTDFGIYDALAPIQIKNNKYILPCEVLGDSVFKEIWATLRTKSIVKVQKDEF